MRAAFFGRDGHAGPVHSSTAGPGWIHAPVPDGGEGWWHGLAVRHGRPIRVRLADGELVLLGDARRVALIVAGHRNDTVSSALARVAERFACPDASARIVIDRIDEGGVGRPFRPARRPPPRRREAQQLRRRDLRGRSRLSRSSEASPSRPSREPSPAVARPAKPLLTYALRECGRDTPSRTD